MHQFKDGSVVVVVVYCITNFVPGENLMMKIEREKNKKRERKRWIKRKKGEKEM